MKIFPMQNSSEIVLVDDEDYERFKHLRFYLNSKGYAQSTRYRTKMLHRMIMKCPKNKTVHHIDHNPRNNQKENLMILSMGDNLALSRRRPSRCSYRNVRRHGKFFRCRVTFDNKSITSKRFNTAFQAAVEAQNLYSIYRPDLDIDFVWRSN